MSNHLQLGMFFLAAASLVLATPKPSFGTSYVSCYIISKRAEVHRRVRAWRLAGLVAVLFAWMGGAADAGPVNGSFQVDIGESERTLAAMLEKESGSITPTEFLAIQSEEMHKNPSLRLIDRNRPAIVLQNTSDSTGGDLTRFDIDLQEAGHEFGNGDFNPDPFAGGLTLLSDRTDVGISMTSSYGTVSDVDLTEDRTKLVLDILGLTPGKAMFFRLDLDPNPVTHTLFPDYQHVMLGGDLGDGNGPADPSLISAVFVANGMTAAINPTEFNPEIDHVLEMAGMIEGHRSQSKSAYYTSRGSTEQVPEPSTVMLLLAGMAGFGSSRRSRRR
jgi:hypothetical protein